MTIKDFEKGQTAYILNMHKGRNTEPTIMETMVAAIGRKYVTVSNGNRYETDNDNPYGLIEVIDWGDRTILCPSRTDAEMYIERDKLQMWLCSASNFGRDKYSLEQLRKVKAILEPEAEGKPGLRS